MSDECNMARAAYRAYGESVSFRNFAGNPMPEWDELPDAIRTAWEAAAGANRPDCPHKQPSPYSCYECNNAANVIIDQLKAEIAQLNEQLMERASLPDYERGVLDGQDQLMAAMQAPDVLEGNSALSELLRTLRDQWATPA